jgi:hypothetical protein
MEKGRGVKGKGMEKGRGCKGKGDGRGKGMGMFRCVLITRGCPHRVEASSSRGVSSSRGGVLVAWDVLVAWGCPHCVEASWLRGGVLVAVGVSSSRGGCPHRAGCSRGGVSCCVGVTWPVSGWLVGWAREEMGWRGLTVTTTTIIRRRPPLSPLVVGSRLRATSPTVRRCVPSLTSQPSSFIIVVARPEGTVDVPCH